RSGRGLLMSTDSAAKSANGDSAVSSVSAHFPAGTNEQPVVRLRNLNHYFGDGEARKQVLYDNHLEIMPGEIVIMTGPSGSGKTPLLTLTGAVRTVHEGSMEVLGSDLTSLSAGALVEVRRNIGFIFQAHNLFAALTAHQNVCMSLQLQPWEARA